MFCYVMHNMAWTTLHVAVRTVDLQSTFDRVTPAYVYIGIVEANGNTVVPWVVWINSGQLIRNMVVYHYNYMLLQCLHGMVVSWEIMINISNSNYRSII